MVKWSHVVVWVLYFFLPSFLVVYFLIVFGFGISLNLTPVVLVGTFPYLDLNILRASFGVVGVADFLTWGWSAKLAVSLIGLFLSIILLPLNILLAFIPSFVSQGFSLRESARKASNYIRFLLKERRVRKWVDVFTILSVWTLANILVATLFIYLAQVTLITPTLSAGILVLPPTLQDLLSKAGDPALLLPFIPLRYIHTGSFGVSGLLFYINTFVSYFSVTLVILWMGYLVVWAAKYRKFVEESMGAFNKWLSKP
ncbi:MAG: hypothetical protein KIH08_13500 [Candidatus Freyarchaeota archaeon]|nr:hypothetical protein [Candidatus Jordarchaeia archaeon]MBS7269796.1 hypothetical protein [Candidatus Jordarchaeia archaeon]MBS7280080.1 hypothetical protein [Candidatus Jordarchaeia archaeon]